MPPPLLDAAPVERRFLRGGEVMVHLPVAWSQVAWGCGALAMFGAVLWVANHARAVSVPLVAAFFAAYVLNPLVDRAVRWGLPRRWAIVILLSSFLATTVLIGLLLGPRVVQEAREVPDKLRQLLVVVRPAAKRLFDWDFPDSLDSVLVTLQQQLGLQGQATLAALARRASATLGLVFGGTLSALASLGAVAITPVFTCFFLHDFPRISEKLKSLWPRRSRAAMERTVAEIDAMLSRFVRGQLIVGAILALLYVVGFYLVGLPLALLVGIITGLGNMVPFVGTAIGLLFATMFSLLNFHGWVPLLMAWGVFVVNHVLEAWLITPRIVGTSVGLSAFWVIVAVLLFGDLLGFTGILVAVPLAAVLKIFAREAMRHYQASTFYQGSAPT